MLPALPPISLQDIGYGWIAGLWLWPAIAAVAATVGFAIYARTGKSRWRR